MKRFLVILFSILFGLIALVASAVGAILLKPSLVLTDHNFRIAARLLEKEGIGISWGQLSIALERHSFLDLSLIHI